MFGRQLAREDRQRLDEAHSIATSALQAIRDHAHGCELKEQQREVGAKDFRHTLNNTLQRMSGDIEAARRDAKALRSWIVGFILTVGGAIITGLLAMVGWLLVTYVLRGPVAAIPLALLAALPALAHDGPDPWSRWILEQRSESGASCCSMEDCHKTQQRNGPAGVEALVPGVGWVRVPPGSWSPDGNPFDFPTICYRNGAVRCWFGINET